MAGGAAVASRISTYLKSHRDEYQLVVASRDWHDAGSDNGGHFALSGDTPDYVNSWPVHCVNGSPGADYHKNLDTSGVDVHIVKGMGKPSYSIFEGVTPEGKSLSEILTDFSITEIDVAGLATDYCVLASSLDARSAGFQVTVLTDLVAGVAPESSSQALKRLAAEGCKVA